MIFGGASLGGRMEYKRSVASRLLEVVVMSC